MQRIFSIILLLTIACPIWSQTDREDIIKAADNCLNGALPCVTDKQKTCSGDKKNYESLGIYFWPNPTDSAAPYIFKDGYKNPETRLYDGEKINMLSYMCRNLSKAYLMTHDKKYAKRWNDCIKTWFLKKSTSMNTNFEYAQIRFNYNNNRGDYYGIIEAYVLTNVVESIHLMTSEKAFPKRNLKKAQRWFRNFSTWLCESENGRKQRDAGNNLSLAYDVMMWQFYDFTGDITHRDSITDSFAKRRLYEQIAEDGSQPLELKRAKPMSYHIYNMEHVLDFCKMQQRSGNNYYQQHKERIDKAMQYMEATINGHGLLNNLEKNDKKSLQNKLEVLKDGFTSL